MFPLLIKLFRIASPKKRASKKRVTNKRASGARTLRLNPLGKQYNLKEIYDEINARYFEDKLALGITWVGNGRSKPRRRVMFGSYNQRTQLIKIHRRLDEPHVPKHFVSYVVYHEMLHHVLPPIKGKRGKRSIHHSEFLDREKMFHEYALAKEYSKSVKTSWFG